MFRVPSAVQECYGSLLGCIQQSLAGCRIVGQFGPVPTLEFVPFGWIVAEPATQIVAGRNFLEPGIHLQCLLFHSPRPEALHKETLAILFGGRIIHPFNLDHHQCAPIQPAGKTSIKQHNSAATISIEALFFKTGSVDRAIKKRKIVEHKIR